MTERSSKNIIVLKTDIHEIRRSRRDDDYWIVTAIGDSEVMFRGSLEDCTQAVVDVEDDMGEDEHHD